MAIRDLEAELKLAPWLIGGTLILAIVGALSFIGILIALDFVVDDFDPFTDTISQHANNAGALWINAAFIVAGITLVAAGYPVRLVIKRRWAKNVLAATFLVGGLCVAGLAFYPTDPPGADSGTGIIHLVLAGVGIFSIMIGAVAGSWAFVHEEGWPHRGFFSTCMAGVIIGTFLVVFTVVLGSKVSPGTAVGGALGLTERAVVMAELVWATHMVGRIFQVGVLDGRLIVDGDDVYIAGVARRVQDAPEPEPAVVHGAEVA